jgi:hypothetical protein
MARSAKA